jgi:hypothetical protein
MKMADMQRSEEFITNKGTRVITFITDEEAIAVLRYGHEDDVAIADLYKTLQLSYLQRAMLHERAVQLQPSSGMLMPADQNPVNG